MFRRAGLPVLCVFVFTLLPSVASAQTRRLLDVGLEDLMQIHVEPVFGASMRLQPVTQAPASVTIVTRDEIARYGYRTLADILRGVRGFQVSYDRNYSYLGARGFAQPGDYNTRILLLIDGHRVNDNIYESAQIGTELGLDPFMFERVEIVRGPSASLYGTSAFFAVVNVIMRKGDEIDGLVVRGETGSFSSRTAQVAAGRALKQGDWSLSGSYAGTAGAPRLYFPAFDHADTHGGIADHLDGEQGGQVFGRLRLHGLTLTGAYGHRTKDVPTAAYYTKFNSPEFETIDRRGFIDADLSRKIGGTQVMLRGYIDRYHYTGHYPFETADPNQVDLYSDYAVGVWAGMEARGSREIAGRQTLTVGAEWRDNFRQSQGATLNGSVDDGFAISASSHAGAVYVQDEIAVHRLLRVSAGIRYDEYGDWSRVTPRAAIIATPSVRQAFKYLYGTAFRAPNAFELDYYTAGVRDTTLRPETIASHELVWEQYTGTWLRTSLSVYRNRVSRLLALVDDPSEEHEFLFHNQGGATAKGFEAETEWRFKHVEGLGSYALQETTDQNSGMRLTNSPLHVVKLRVSTPASRSFPSVAFETHHLSSRDTLAGNVLNPVHIANLTVTAPLTKRVEIVASIRNLFANAYADPGSEEHREDVLMQDGRTFTVGMRWRE